MEAQMMGPEIGGESSEVPHPLPGTAPAAHPETFPPNARSHSLQKLQYFRLHRLELRLGKNRPARIACCTAGYNFCVCSTSDGSRSEERRVGKEGRSRWGPY